MRKNKKLILLSNLATISAIATISLISCNNRNNNEVAWTVKDEVNSLNSRVFKPKFSFFHW